MAETKESQSLREQEYLAFVERRARTTDFKAAEKLAAIDEMAEVVFAARHSYRQQKVSSGGDDSPKS